MNVVARGSISRSKEYELKLIVTWSSHYRCLGEIQLFETPLLIVLSVLSVNSVNILEIEVLNMNLLWELTIGIP